MGLGLAVVVLLTWAIGRLMGTAWGTFTLGLLLFDLSGVQVARADLVVETLILLATWSNQWSLSADNVQMLLGPAHASRHTLRAVRSVPTFPRYPRWQARYSQYGLLLVSLGMALL